MSLTRIYAVFLRQMYLFRSTPTRLTSVFVWLIVDIVQWGFISRYLGTMGQATFNFLNVILGAIILWEFNTRIQQGIMTAFLEDIWSQNFINFFASPLKVVEYLSGLVLTAITAGMAGFIVVVILAGAAFGYDLLTVGVALIPFVAILFVFGTAMGLFVSGIIFRLGPNAEWLGWPIPLVLSIFTGVYYPIATLPVPMQLFSRLIPPSYVFESMRALLTHRATLGDIVANLMIGALISVAYLVAGYWFFMRIYRHNLESGAIARFNAESL
jgi:ABC-2 type transport system permease protein